MEDGVIWLHLLEISKNLTQSQNKCPECTFILCNKKAISKQGFDDNNEVSSA